MLNECNGCEYQCNLSHIDICTLGSPCPHQRSTPMTEQEWLQTSSTEQLAEFLFRIAYMCSYCGDEAHSTEEKTQKCHFGKCYCQRQDWEMWLKQPHKDTK